MPNPIAIVLNSGDLRSLVATALLAAEEAPPDLVFIFLSDGRAALSSRQEHAHRQAEHFKAKQMIDLDLPHALPRRRADWQGASPKVAMNRAHLLVTALSHAIEMPAQRVVWPAQYDGNFQKIARATEQVELVSHLAEMEHGNPPELATPLLELTDRQLIELGNQLNAPWRLAWSCQVQDNAPCRACTGCQRRHAAFEAAGVEEPGEAAVVAR
jgi:7-cyano-7-deazaguanine synthase